MTVSPSCPTPDRDALVIAVHSRIIILSQDGFDFQARLAGRLQRAGGVGSVAPVVGDRVTIAAADGGEWRITGMAPRQSDFSRHETTANVTQTLAANATLAVIVIAPQPMLDFMWGERLLIGARRGSVPGLLVINKADLLDDEDLEDRPAYLDQAGIAWLLVSAKTGQGMEELEKRLAGQTALFAGHSGVGKSTLLNRLVPAAGAKIGELNRLGYGNHATSMAQYYAGPLFNLIDLAGLREFPLKGLIPLDELPGYFNELKIHLGACRFRDCRHLHEPGCAVLAGLDHIDPRRRALFEQLHSEAAAK